MPAPRPCNSAATRQPPRLQHPDCATRVPIAGTANRSTAIAMVDGARKNDGVVTARLIRKLKCRPAITNAGTNVGRVLSTSDRGSTERCQRVDASGPADHTGIALVRRLSDAFRPLRTRDTPRSQRESSANWRRSVQHQSHVILRHGIALVPYRIWLCAPN